MFREIFQTVPLELKSFKRGTFFGNSYPPQKQHDTSSPVQGRSGVSSRRLLHKGRKYLSEKKRLKGANLVVVG